MPFKILTIGFESAVSYLGELQRVMYALNSADIAKMRKIGENDVLQHFRDQRFKKLAPSTIARRRANAKARRRNPKIGVPSDKILIVSKRLMLGTKSFATSTGFIMQNKQPHFGPHNFGYGFIPQREFMYFNESAVNAMVLVPFTRLEAVANRVR